MARLTILVSTLVIVLGNGLIGIFSPSVDAASQATPTAASVATRDNGEELDLPALVLQPADLVAVGLGEGFGSFGGKQFALPEAAELSARNRGDTSASRVAEITATLEDAGFRQGYSLDLGTPADTPVGLGVQVSSEIIEYADAAGAAAGFAFATDTTEVVDLEVAEVAGARRFGDESLALQWSGGEPATGTAFQALSIQARVGRLVLYTAAYGPADQPPALAVAEALMERLLERVAREARPARGELDYQFARLRGAGVETHYDSYWRLDGVTVPQFGDTAETLARRAPGLAATSDFYFLSQSVLAGADGSQDDAHYVVWLYRFASPEVATAWLAGYLFGLFDRPVVADMPPLGDWALTHRDVDERGDGVTAPGFETYLRTGKDVLILEVSAGPGIDRAGYEELVVRNADCLRSGFCLDPVPLPQDLITREGLATPEAASSRTQATPTVVASEATPVAESPATRDIQEALELPALVLQPADLVAVGLGEGFGIYGGNLFALAAAAELVARNRGDDSAAHVAELTTVLEDARFRQGYSLAMTIPADNPAGVGVGVASEVNEYADAAGAAAGFAFFSDPPEVADIEFEEVAGARRFGDESLTLRASAVDPMTGDSFPSLSIEARVGRLVLLIVIYGAPNQPPDLAVAEALMERFLERVAREARPARGEVSYLVPRLGGAGVETNSDSYERLNGVNWPQFGDTAETQAGSEVGLATVRDRFYVGQLVPAGEDGAQDDVGYNAVLNRFASVEEAAAWLSGYLRSARELPIVADMPPLGDEAITFIREVERSDGRVAPGFVTYLRSGTDVLRLAVNGVPGIEQAGYEELLARNVDCLRSGFCLEPAPAPPDLISREGIATPQAASLEAPATPSVDRPATAPMATP